MGHLGTYALLLGLALAGYGAVAAAFGARTARPALVDSARRSAYGLFATVAVVNGAMLVALLRNDFALRYVARELVTPDAGVLPRVVAVGRR